MHDKCDQHTWLTSSYCGTTQCVAVSVGPETVRIRDTAEVAGPELAFDRSEWAEFVTALKSETLGQTFG